MATGDFGPGRMPPDMFLNCNEEIKRQKEQTVGNQKMLISTVCSRDRGQGQGQDLGQDQGQGQGQGQRLRDGDSVLLDPAMLAGWQPYLKPGAFGVCYSQLQALWQPR